VTADEVNFDFGRRARIGLAEAVLCAGKSVGQVEHILGLAHDRDVPLLLTRLDAALYESLTPATRNRVDYDPVSRTGIAGEPTRPTGPPRIVVVSAGSSDVPCAREAVRTLVFHGVAADEIHDVGVAGLWRLLEQQERLQRYEVVIVAAGMDGALVSVVGGLVHGVVIAVPTPTGYGTARGGETALHAALSSCAPGVVVVNIGNGYGAACAALRVVHAAARAAQRTSGAATLR